MKTCQVHSKQDRTNGRQEPCGEPVEFKIKYQAFLHYPAHTAYMCAKHAEMAIKLVKVEVKVD